jgi:hypothetical protein
MVKRWENSVRMAQKAMAMVFRKNLLGNGLLYNPTCSFYTGEKYDVIMSCFIEDTVSGKSKACQGSSMQDFLQDLKGTEYDLLLEQKSAIEERRNRERQNEQENEIPMTGKIKVDIHAVQKKEEWN